ncbi:hypothetical protein H9Q73_002456 [Fusarium xylarioides]|nr:hypothetical protein H9Q73_002456 [Fusarium xylarioides]
MGLETTYAGVRLDILWTASHNTLSGFFAAIARKTGWYPVIFQEVDLVVVLEVAHVVLLAVAPGACLPIVDLDAAGDGAGAAGTAGTARTFHADPFLDGRLRLFLGGSLSLWLDADLRLCLNCSVLLFVVMHLVITATALPV